MARANDALDHFFFLGKHGTSATELARRWESRHPRTVSELRCRPGLCMVQVGPGTPKLHGSRQPISHPSGASNKPTSPPTRHPTARQHEHGSSPLGRTQQTR
ncbi:hypothetical protein ACET3X_004714 [Alternaria dauci]|uniref:Uncharacterized protein n=1 Tax=Alternaria dauci TaxID=48095 RepID=A0ABR3UKM7_9PLEO